MSAPKDNVDSVESLSSMQRRSESPLISIADDFRTALDEFRSNWHRELKSKTVEHQQQQPQEQQQIQEPSQTAEEAAEENDVLNPLYPNETTVHVDEDTLAERYFRKAVELEQRGKVYDALPFYRKAVQMVPDIEFKFYEEQKQKMPIQADAPIVNKPKKCITPVLPDEAEFIEDLYEKFQIDLANEYGGKLLLSNRDASVITTELHMSDLPTEIILYILRWVVSSQLDMRSLEQCAAVCKGLYLCARDDELWRVACEKVWGINLGTLENPTAPGSSELIMPLRGYSSWRQMFIERDRVLFNGCYISKTTYLRMGENSFQDQYYRPVQLVEYYRYVRFLPDGTVYMMTNADEPAQGVAKLKSIQQLRADVLRGEYRLYGNTVTILLQKQQQQQRIIPTSHQYGRHRRGSSMLAEDLNCTKYCIEFRIVNTPKRKFAQLVWQHYSIVQTRNRIETSSEFDLVQSKYPPLWFSPVRSYHLDADSPLA